MTEYLVLAENITFKNNKLSCINIYDRLSTTKDHVYGAERIRLMEQELSTLGKML